MNCFNHPKSSAVATCVVCGKGLCKKCSIKFSDPICNDCNGKRETAEKWRQMAADRRENFNRNFNTSGVYDKYIR